ncbi:hypothetical protein TNCV_2876251 [Trichonephila clavipes]|nr:hypothetical protein TNCV_2876251 [Trichonephila clavipes]
MIVSVSEYYATGQDSIRASCQLVRTFRSKMAMCSVCDSVKVQASDPLNCSIRKQRRSLNYEGDSMETKRNVGDRVKLATWQLIELYRSRYTVEPPGGELQ